jgi:inosine-uridine nucleoside N-ribohydrolase
MGFRPWVDAMTKFYRNAYKNIGGYDGSMPLHDPSALLLLLEPSLWVPIFPHIIISFRGQRRQGRQRTERVSAKACAINLLSDEHAL